MKLVDLGLTEHELADCNNPDDIQFEKLCDQLVELIPSIVNSENYGMLCIKIRRWIEAAHSVGVQETKEKLGYAAEYLGVKGTWQKIEKLSHEM